jgi:hypothetical protein
LADFQAFVERCVVDHDCLAWPKLWHKHVLDVNFENGFRAKSLKRKGSLDFLTIQGGDEGQATLLIAMFKPINPWPLWPPGVRIDFIIINARFIQIHKISWVFLFYLLQICCTLALIPLTKDLADTKLLADKGYDIDAFLKMLAQ